MEILSKLLTAKFLVIYGPLGAISILLAGALAYLHKRHEELHKEYLERVLKLKDEYIGLAQQLERTLDTLISVISKKRN